MKLKYKILICFAVVGALVLPWPLLANPCRVQRVVHPVYGYHQYAQQVVLKQIYPPYYYAIGSELQIEALAEKVTARIEQKLKAKERAEAPKTILSTKCATCHSPGKKAVTEDDAPLFFDAEGNLTATPEQRASMKTASKLGAMPPSKELDDDSYLQLVRELEKAP